MEHLNSTLGIDTVAAEPTAKDCGREDRKLIDALKGSATFKKFAGAFREITGLPLELRLRDTWSLPLHRTENESPFCALMAERNRACAACLTTQEKLKVADGADSYSTQCPFGPVDSVAPVRLGSRVIGYLQTGQALLSEPEPGHEAALRTSLQEWGMSEMEDDALAALSENHRMSPEEYEAALKLLEVFAEQLGDLANRVALETTHREPAMIQRAKAFIHSNYQEELSLGRVAREVNASAFYLCKMFRKATGLNFTEYVSRIRVEKARVALSNPQLRVSEIAFDVGFQSLTHFNRVFKNMMGCSPTEYRNRARVATSEPALAGR